jgi:hypothetical protein
VTLEANPALVKHARERATSVQNRIADRITAFAGSMRFVYLHMAWFGLWIGYGVEGYPYGLLTIRIRVAFGLVSVLHDQHGHLGVVEHVVGNRAQHDRPDCATATRPHHDQVVVGCFRPLQ